LVGRDTEPNRATVCYRSSSSHFC